MLGKPQSPYAAFGRGVWRRGRRKERNVNTEKIRHMHFELTEAQYQMLSANAKQCGLSRRAFLVRLIEGTPVKACPSYEIQLLRTEIHHIGNNINQIARSVNAGIAKAEDAEQAVYLLGQVYELMFKISNL